MNNFPVVGSCIEFNDDDLSGVGADDDVVFGGS